jgi:hypothetical protein
MHPQFTTSRTQQTQGGMSRGKKSRKISKITNPCR